VLLGRKTWDDWAAFWTTRLVNGLKRQPGNDVGVHGSISLTQTLLELRLLFEQATPTRLRLTRSITSAASRAASRWTPPTRVA